MDEKVLVKKAKHGDVDAFGKLYEKILPLNKLRSSALRKHFLLGCIGFFQISVSRD